MEIPRHLKILVEGDRLWREAQAFLVIEACRWSPATWTDQVLLF